METNLTSVPDLTTEEAAAALKLHRATVQRLLKTGRLKGYQIGRSWRIPPSAMDVFRKQGAHQGPMDLTDTVSVLEDYEKWERLLLDESNLAKAPAIPLDAMRRENIYEDHR